MYSAYNERFEFGLITKEPSVHDKRAGRIPNEVAQQVRHGRVKLHVERFRIVDDGLRTSAVGKVMDVLAQHPAPTRFQDFDPAAEPRGNAWPVRTCCRTRLGPDAVPLPQRRETAAPAPAPAGMLPVVIWARAHDTVGGRGSVISAAGCRRRPVA